MSVDDRLRQVFADVFDVDVTTLEGGATPHTIEAWDSLTHLNLVFALEGEFSVQFEAEQIPDLVSFEAIRERISGEGRSDG